MENELRIAILSWLRSESALAALNLIDEEAPLASTPPWLGIAASASTDWGTKDRTGREVRLAFELETRIDDPQGDVGIVELIEQRILSFPSAQAGFEVASIYFLRARTERRAANLRGTLLEYRFRVLRDS